MHWVLIFYVVTKYSYSGGPFIESVRFDTRDACLQAGEFLSGIGTAVNGPKFICIEDKA